MKKLFVEFRNFMKSFTVWYFMGFKMKTEKRRIQFFERKVANDAEIYGALNTKIFYSVSKEFLT